MDQAAKGETARGGSGFGALGRVISRHPRTVVGLMAGLLAVTLLPLSTLRIDSSFEGFLPEDDPTRVAYQEFRETFGQGEFAVVAARGPSGVVDAHFLADLARLHRAIERDVPLVSRVKSLVNGRVVRGDEDTLIVEELLADGTPDSPAALERFRERVLATPLYENLFVSSDLEWALLVVEPENLASAGNEGDTVLDAAAWTDSQPTGERFTTSDDMTPLVEALQSVVAGHRASDLELRVGGGLVVGTELAETVKWDFASLFALALVLIGALVRLFFRSFLATGLVIGVVVLSLASSLGVMALLEIPVGFATQILPCFLLAAGVGYSVHVLTRFVQAQARLDDRVAAVEFALERAGGPVAMTGITTMAGLASFAGAELRPVALVGWIGPIGALFGLLYSLVLLPALLVLIERPLPLPSRGWTRIADGLARIGFLAASHPRKVVCGVLIVVLVACVGVSRLRFSHDPLSWIDSDSELRQTSELLDRAFEGAYALEVIVEPRDGGTVAEPDRLAQFARFEQEVTELEVGRSTAGKVLGLHQVVGEIHAALEGTLPSETPLPDDPRVIAQELLLFENTGSDDLESLTDSSYGRGRITVRVPWADGAALLPFLEHLERLARAVFGDGVSVHVTGLFAIQARTFIAVLQTAVDSYGIALLAIGSLMMLWFRSVRVGLASLVPNVVPMLVTLGLMGFLGRPVDFFTLLIGSIALGVAVDDTVHLWHHSRGRAESRHDTAEAIARALATDGLALCFSSALLTCGFLAFGFASLRALHGFGAFAAFAVLAAFVFDLLLSPSLIALLEGGASRSQPALPSRRMEPAS